MGNHIACIHQLPPDVSPDRTIKLIRPDGLVKIYHRPIPASELMLQFPKHLICHSDSFFIGQKIPPLSQSDYLVLGHKYFLLPTHFFQSVLSFVTLTSIASSTLPAKKADFVKNISSCRLFDVQKTPSGTLQIRVSDEFIARLVEEGKMRGDDDDDDEEQGEGDSTATATVKMSKGRVCTTPELEKDYTRLVGCRRSREWKPKLETIREKDKKKLARKLSSFGMKKRKKSTSHAPKGNQKSTSHAPKGNQKSKKAEKLTPPHPHPPPPPPPPPPLKFPKLRIPKRRKQKQQQQPSQQQEQMSEKSKGPPPPPPPPPLKFPKLRIPKRRKQKQEQQPQQQQEQMSKQSKGPPPPPPPPPPPLKFPKLRIPKRRKQKQQQQPQQQEQMIEKSKGKEKKRL